MVIKFANDYWYRYQQCNKRKQAIWYAVQGDSYECIKRKEYTITTRLRYMPCYVRCAKIMQRKISALVYFESKIYDNPIKLLKAIQEHSMY